MLASGCCSTCVHHVYIMCCFDLLSFLVRFNFILIIIISTLETLDITPESINRTPEKIGPDCFELLKVLGKGGYGKVRIEREREIGRGSISCHC